MASLFELSRRRKHAKDWADQFREGASPEELEYFNRFYQEPSASPILQQGALEGELDSADALQRQLMARGMNNLQAQDRVSREGVERDAEFGRSRELYQQAHPNEGVAASSPLSYQRYTEDYAPYTQTDDQGVEAAMTGDPMSEQDFLNKQIARQRLAGDTSAAADAQYKSETVDDRIAMIAAQAETMPAELQAKGASAEVTTAYMQELGRQIQITRENAPDTPEYKNAVTAVENLHKLYKGTSGGGGLSSYSAQGFIDDKLQQGITQSQASGDTVVEQDGQKMIVPRQTNIEGEYRR
jgi:hypothetical protein|tara:strand:+ start:247 stop:1140 length:894 start_codon:yes stop_codon:yes gene_type:complete